MNELKTFEDFLEAEKDQEMMDLVLSNNINIQPVIDALKGRLDIFYEDISYIPAYARKVVEFI